MQTHRIPKSARQQRACAECKKTEARWVWGYCLPFCSIVCRERWARAKGWPTQVLNARAMRRELRAERAERWGIEPCARCLAPINAARRFKTHSRAFPASAGHRCSRATRFPPCRPTSSGRSWISLPSLRSTGNVRYALALINRWFAATLSDRRALSESGLSCVRRCSCIALGALRFWGNSLAVSFAFHQQPTRA